MRSRRAARAAWATLAEAGAAPRGTVVRPRPARSRRPTLEDLDAIDQTIPAIQVLDLRLAPKPRMTQSDRWNKRPTVLRYRASCDELRLRGARLPHHFVAIVFRAMPDSWSAAERHRMNLTPCTSKPDASNLQKTLEDALHLQDQHIYDGRTRKLWAYADRLIILNAHYTQDIEQAVASHQPKSPHISRLDELGARARQVGQPDTPA